MAECNEDTLNAISNSISHPELTNCMMSITEIKQKIERDQYKIINYDPLILIENHNSYTQVFYFLKDVTDAKTAANVFKDYTTERPPLYADITTKEEYRFDGTIFDIMGLRPYRTYVRKSVINKNLSFRTMCDTEYAKLSDVTDINSLLVSQFDLMCDHIPDIDELTRLVNEQKILKISINNKIAGVLLFDDFGKRSYARALCVDPEYQNSFVGYSLLADYFKKHDEDKTRLFYLWVDEANDSVKKLHDRFGYKVDGMKNYIFRKG